MRGRERGYMVPSVSVQGKSVGRAAASHWREGSEKRLEA